MAQQNTRPDRADLAPAEWTLLESSTVVATLALSPDARILSANARMRALLGAAAPADLQGRSLDEFLVDGDRGSLAAKLLSGGSLSLRARSLTGAVVRLRGDLRRLRTARGPAFCGVFVEEGEDERLRAAVQHSARMEALGGLTAGVAHDFNNLLTVLVGNLYLAAEDVRDRPKTFERIKSARDASKRGADLIKQLLAFARREQVETEVIDPCKVVSELEPLLKRALGARIALRTETEAEAGKVRASTAQLESVIVNLVINARDAIAEKGNVTIKVASAHATRAPRAANAAHAGDYVVVSVADDGCGMAPETAARVFEPFFSTKRDRGGSGLGLAMVRWFAEQGGGSIDLDSAPGRGTTIALWLPRSADPTGPIDTRDMTMPLSTLPTGTERVVVVAGDEAVRSTLDQTLEVLGYRVRFEADEAAALASLQAAPADLLIVDGPLADDGSFVERCRAASPGLRALVMTGPLSPTERAAPGGRAMRLPKPFTLADLAKAVRRALDASAS